MEWRFVNDPANADLVPEPVFPKPLFPRMAAHGLFAMADGDMPVPGLRVIHLGGHTVGSMAVEVLSAAKPPPFLTRRSGFFICLRGRHISPEIILFH